VAICIRRADVGLNALRCALTIDRRVSRHGNDPLEVIEIGATGAFGRRYDPA